MRALGFSPGAVTGLFVLESVALALMFSAAGALLGALACEAAKALLSFPPGSSLGIVLDGGHLALEPRPADMALVTGLIALFAALFSFFPARRGGRIPPVEALTATF